MGTRVYYFIFTAYRLIDRDLSERILRAKTSLLGLTMAIYCIVVLRIFYDLNFRTTFHGIF